MTLTLVGFLTACYFYRLFLVLILGVRLVQQNNQKSVSKCISNLDNDDYYFSRWGVKDFSDISDNYYIFNQFKHTY